MNDRNKRPRFRLNGMPPAFTVLLPGMLASQMIYAASGNEVRTILAQASGKQQKEETIQVTASPGDISPTFTLKTPISSGALGTATALDTPFSVSTVTEKDIQDKQITTARDLFSDNASVTTQSNAYSNYGSQFSVRGISSGWDSFINGLPITAISQEAHPEMFEQVDVLKGATGFMYGFGAPGGAINYVTKRPTDETTLTVTTGYRSNGVFSQGIDAGGRGGMNNRVGFRLNLVNEQGGLPVRDARISRQAIGLGLDAQLTSDALLYGNLIYGKRYIKNPSAASFSIRQLAKSGESLPSPIRLSQLKTRIDDGQIDDRSLFSQAGFKWDFTENWRIQTDYVFQKNNERFVSPLPDLTRRDGDYIMKVYDTKVFNTNQVLQTVIQGQFDTGFISHELNTGLSNRIYKTARSPDAFFGTVGSGNIFEPMVFDYHKKSMPAPSVYNRTTERAVFISDRIAFNDHWEFLAGLRHTDYQSVRPGDKAYKKSVNTPTLALIFKPEANTRIYTSYVEALEKGSTVGEKYKNAGKMLPPLKSKQYEVGIKTDQTRWSATTALFRIERGAEYVNADNIYVQDGEERYQGLEVGGKVIITRNLDLSASTMYLDPTYRNVAPTKNIEGKSVAGVPRFRSTLELGWVPDNLPDLKTSLRWRHEGSSGADEQGDIHVPSHDLLDLYVNYDTDTFGYPVTARFGVTNLTDKKYWTADAYNSVYAGEPRTFMANIRVLF